MSPEGIRFPAAEGYEYWVGVVMLQAIYLNFHAFG
jgi:hypothetical protein